MTRHFEFLDHPGPIPFAHRGGAAESPENTRASFSHALRLGYRYLETDVHATSDAVVVVIHDPDLARTADRPGRIVDMPWAEAREAVLPGGQQLLRLDEVFDEWPDVRWNIDAKHEAVVEPLVEVIRSRSALARVCITSFSDGRLARIRRSLGPELCTGAGPAGIAAMRVGSAAALPGLASLTRRAWAGAAAAQVPLRQGRITIVDEHFVGFAHRNGLSVHVWTIDDEGAMDRLLDLGVDGIMTDRPTLLRDVLQRRGQWFGAT